MIENLDGITNCMTGARCPNGTSPPPCLQHLNPMHSESRFNNRDMYFWSVYSKIAAGSTSADIGSILDLNLSYLQI